MRRIGPPAQAGKGLQHKGLGGGGTCSCALGRRRAVGPWLTVSFLASRPCSGRAGLSSLGFLVHELGVHEHRSSFLGSVGGNPELLQEVVMRGPREPCPTLPTPHPRAEQAAWPRWVGVSGSQGRLGDPLGLIPGATQVLEETGHPKVQGCVFRVCSLHSDIVAELRQGGADL